MLYLQLVVLRPVALAAGEAFLVVSQALLHDLLGLEDSPSAPRTSPPHAAGLRLFIHRNILDFKFDLNIKPLHKHGFIILAVVH